MRIDWKLIACILGACALDSVIDLYRRPSCSDCFRHHGWQFPYFREGGFAGGAHFVLGGMLGDAVVVLTCGMLLWMILGFRSVSRAGPEQNLTKYCTWGWIRIAYGAVLLLDLVGVVWNQAHGCIDPKFMPNNGAEWAGMVVGYGLITLAAYWLVYGGIRRLNKPTECAAITSA